MRSFVVMVFEENVTTFVYCRRALCSWVGNAVAEHGDYLENRIQCQKQIQLQNLKKCDFYQM